jgi:hypothetical protein
MGWKKRWKRRFRRIFRAPRRIVKQTVRSAKSIGDLHKKIVKEAERTGKIPNKLVAEAKRIGKLPQKLLEEAERVARVPDKVLKETVRISKLPEKALKEAIRTTKLPERVWAEVRRTQRIPDKVMQEAIRITRIPGRVWKEGKRLVTRVPQSVIDEFKRTSERIKNEAIREALWLAENDPLAKITNRQKTTGLSLGPEEDQEIIDMQAKIDALKAEIEALAGLEGVITLPASELETYEEEEEPEEFEMIDPEEDDDWDDWEEEEVAYIDEDMFFYDKRPKYAITFKTANRPRLYGMVNMDTRPYQITINKNANPLRQEVSVIHEMLHVILDLYKIPMPHDTLHALAIHIQSKINPLARDREDVETGLRRFVKLYRVRLKEYQLQNLVGAMCSEILPTIRKIFPKR